MSLIITVFIKLVAKLYVKKHNHIIHFAIQVSAPEPDLDPCTAPGVLLTASSGSVESNGGSSYANNMNCRWKISAQSNKVGHISIHS